VTYLSLFITLLFAFSNSYARQIEEFQLAPSFHVFSVSAFSSQGCQSNLNQTVRFDYYENQYLERLNRLSLKISPIDDQLNSVRILGQTRTKSDAVLIEFKASSDVVEGLKISWLNTPKQKYFFVTENTECLTSNNNLVSELRVFVH